MREIMVVVKHTIRLLLRNKGFLFFLVVLPILSVLLLNIGDYSDKELVADENGIYKIEDFNERICYSAKASMLPVKVYDSTEGGMGYAFCKELAEAGIFQIFYLRTNNQTEENIQKSIDRTALNDRTGGILYFTEALDKELTTGKITNGMMYFDSHCDERTKLLGTTIQEIANRFMLTDSSNKPFPAVKIEKVDTASESKVTYEQDQQIRRIGYVLAMLTISFLFCGVMIADTVIKERQYKVFNRFKLTELTSFQYIVSKYIVCIISVIIQTVIVALALKLLVNQEYMIGKLPLMIIIGTLGLVFNTLSLSIGILCNNVMNTNYLAFLVWSISGMLSGSYFTLKDAGSTIKSISNLMPQKWGLDAVKMLMLNQGGAYQQFLIAMAAFLIVIGACGVIGTTRNLQD